MYENIIEQLMYLREGRWDGGTRVKKLNGVPIHEARINDADRLLFIVEGDVLYVQYVFVKHEDVNVVARNLQFADGEMLFQDTKEEPVYVKTVQHVLHENASYLYFEIEPDDYLRLIQADDLQEIDLRVFLLPRQVEAVQLPIPCAISGQAGSGKSTVLLYKLIHFLTVYEQPAVYIVKNERLRDALKTQFHQLLALHDDYDRLTKLVRFCTFEQFIGAAMDVTRPYMTEQRFYSFWRNYKRGNAVIAKCQAQHLYAELMSVILYPLLKGKPALTKEQYLTLAPHEAPHFLEKREDVYAFFEAYMNHKQAINSVDLMDRLLATYKKEQVTFMVIDEVQDFYYSELLYLLGGVSEQRIIVAGDEKQAIHYEGFQWARLKAMMFEELSFNRLPAIELEQNFRSPKPVVSLGNELFELAVINGHDDLKFRKNIAFKDGAIPQLLTKEDAKQFIQPATLALTLDRKNEELLRDFCAVNQLPVPIILTVEEAKGLEFEDVFIWDEMMFSPDMIAKNTFKKLYVALTRTLSQLYIMSTNWPNALTSIQFYQPEQPAKQIENVKLFEIIEHLFTEQQFERCTELLTRLTVIPDVKRARFVEIKGTILQLEERFEEAGLFYEEEGCYDDAFYCFERANLKTRLQDLLNFVEKNQLWSSEKIQEKRYYIKLQTLDSEEKWLAGTRLSLRQGKVAEAFQRVRKTEDTVLYTTVVEEILKRSWPLSLLEEVKQDLEEKGLTALALEINKLLKDE